MSDDQLVGDDAVNLIAENIDQRDALTVVSEAYQTFIQLYNTLRSSNETIKNFESRFSAQVAKLNCISSTNKLPECITALMLLSNSAINDSQRVSVMAAAAHSNQNLSSNSTNDEFLSSITYQYVSAVIKRCGNTSQPHIQNETLSASSAGMTKFRGQYRNNNSRNKSESPTMNFSCNICGNYGHWKKNHNRDGSLPSHVKASDASTVSSASKSSSDGQQDRNDNEKKKTISFNMAALVGSSGNTFPSAKRRPLLDDGAPYSAIGLVELKLLADHVGLSSDFKLAAIPHAL